MTLANLISSTLRAAVVASAALSSIAFAGPTSVPFKVKIVTQEELHFDITRVCPVLVGTTTASGQASHMGAVSGISSDCAAPYGNTFVFDHGKLTLTAANGDELRADYNGSLSPTVTPQIYSVAGSYQVTGGTGRCSGASGSGTLQGIENLQTGQGQLQLSGTISY